MRVARLTYRGGQSSWLATALFDRATCCLILNHASSQVDMRKITEALQEMTSSPAILAIRNACKHERLFLQSV